MEQTFQRIIAYFLCLVASMTISAKISLSVCRKDIKEERRLLIDLAILVYGVIIGVLLMF